MGNKIDTKIAYSYGSGLNNDQTKIRPPVQFKVFATFLAWLSCEDLSSIFLPKSKLFKIIRMDGWL